MKHLLHIIVLMLAVSACGNNNVNKRNNSAAEDAGAPAATLKFNTNGEFRIVQFTDLHFNLQKKESIIVLKRIAEVIKAEKPDLVVVTGDIIYSHPAEATLRKIISHIDSCGAPFCAVLGNHDPDFDIPKEEFMHIIRSYPNCVIPSDSPDYVLEVKSSAYPANNAALLYMFDSNAHLFAENGRFIGYDSIHPQQVEWYRQTSSSYAADGTDPDDTGADSRGAGSHPLPALAFMHIPLPEYRLAACSDNSPLIGTRLESVCSPVENTGLFEAFKQQGDVFACFAGHDHDNDYAAKWDDILLAYGRYTGGNTEYNDLPNGARVIVLKEGLRSLDSYIVVKGGEKLYPITFPDSFTFTEWRTRPLDPECL